ncbi:single stranded DNA-binding protein [Aquimarina sp. MAR_2010_214]|uniref:single-stranded DNA-binding protein n=1 Tax=Aquimarina sp. MAR_2010_214 TaxID=1250026 RepID=UPI000C705872|nr:single-stranded DNA-binding protein [Aquimarina sp. MAR_2010_214]PKV50864.1 single stranded DNA-binding protein [Aquimarina sp. MAR_2010_214]
MNIVTNTNNFVQLKGNVTKDVEPITIQNGNQLSKFTIAINKTVINANGQPVSKVSFVDICCWGEVGVATKDLKKGDRIQLIGDLVGNEKSTGQDGKIYYNTYVNAETILSITPKSESVTKT